MSDEGSNADGDVGRYLKAPTPETGFRHAAAAASYVVENMEIQSPDPDQAYGFPDPEARAATGLDDALSLFEGMFLGDPVGQALYQKFMSGEDDLAAFDVAGDAAVATGVDDSFEGMFSHGAPGSQPLINDQFMIVDGEDGLAAAATGVDGSFQGMSSHGAPAGSQPLNDQIMMNDGEDGLASIFGGTDVRNAGGGAAVEPDDVRPVEDHPVLVPVIPGQLDCTNCHTAWEALHEISENHKLHLVVHATGHGNLHHLITDRMYIGADGQTTTSEQMYLDLEQRTHDWVQRFIANLVVALTLDDEAYRPVEVDMLKQINAPATNEEAVAVPQTDPDHAPHQPIIQQAVENSQDDDMLDSSAAECYSHLAEQRKRLSSMSMADVIKLLHLSKQDAAKQLKISASSLQRLCRRNEAGRWPSRSISALNTQIEKLEQAALRNAGTVRLLEIKEKLDKLKDERAKIYDSFIELIRENELKKGAGSSGSK